MSDRDTPDSKPKTGSHDPALSAPERAAARATRLIHSGRDPESQHGFVNPPVYRGSTVTFPTLERLRKRNQPFTYGRRATPTTRALEEALRDLEGGTETILVSSGLQAVAVAILAVVDHGGHLLMTDTVYQPTRAFCDGVLKRMGVTTTYYDPAVGAGISDLIRPETQAVFTEAPGSQTFEMQDIPAIARAAKQRNLWVLMDNTWASPLYFRPLEHGVDLSVLALTKYVVGHADAMLGAVTANEQARARLLSVKEGIGTSPGSEETYLATRGLRTLAVRLERHHESGLEIARWLQQRPEVARVMHPALPTDPGHEIFKRDFDGACGLFGMVLKPAPAEALAAFVDHLSYFDMGYSWGGYESLILPCDPTTSRTATRWTPPSEGFTVRLHIGLEDVEDLKADLSAGFDRFNAVIARA